MADLNHQPVEEGGQQVPERWSTRLKGQVVLRMFRGESIEELSGSLKVPVHELEEWRETFLRGGQEALKARPGNFQEKWLRDAQRKIGELTMELELELELELYKKRALLQDGSRRSEA